jgi:hypothetical protein
MHVVTMVAGGLLMLGIFALTAVLLRRPVADGARIFIWPWLAISVLNLLAGVYWANIPLSVEIPVLAVVFAVPAGVAWFLTRRSSDAD